jgi:SAM-dependent methyltransferase
MDHIFQRVQEGRRYTGLFHFLRRKKQHTPFNWEPTMPVLTAPSDAVDADGRHRDIPYLLPNDEQERQRLDFRHFLLRLVLSGNCFAPVHDLLCRGGNVLDVGCGTGKWGQEIATAYPKARVTGFDVEDMQRTTSPLLNYQFSQGNVLNGLPFASHTFDYVHQRLLVAGIPLDTWPWVVAELRRVTRPSGWIELVEMGTSYPAMDSVVDGHLYLTRDRCLEDVAAWRAVQACWTL